MDWSFANGSKDRSQNACRQAVALGKQRFWRILTVPPLPEREFSLSSNARTVATAPRQLFHRSAWKKRPRRPQTVSNLKSPICDFQADACRASAAPLNAGEQESQIQNRICQSFCLS